MFKLTAFTKPSTAASFKLTLTNLAICSATIVAVLKLVTNVKKQEMMGIIKSYPVSMKMQAFLGSMSKIPYTQALKEIWVYIKQHNLQDIADKEVIICDEKLKKFLEEGLVGFLEIARLISPHFLKRENESAMHTL